MVFSLPLSHVSTWVLKSLPWLRTRKATDLVEGHEEPPALMSGLFVVATDRAPSDDDTGAA